MDRHFDTYYSEKFRVCVRIKFCVAPVIKTLANSSNLISLHRQKSCRIFAENSVEFSRTLKRASGTIYV